MTFHRAPLPMDLIHFMWHHCRPRGIVIFFVVNTFASQFCFSLGTAVTRLHVLEPPHKFDGVPCCEFGLVSLGGFGIVPLRENVPAFFLIPHAGGSHLVLGPRLEYS